MKTENIVSCKYKREMSNNFLVFLRACESGDIEIATSLIDKVDPALSTNWAMEGACKNGHLEIVRLLLADPRVNPADRNNVSIDFAIHYGHIDIVRLLLDDSRVASSLSFMASINWAKQWKRTEIVDLLTEHLYRLDGPEYTKNIL